MNLLSIAWRNASQRGLSTLLTTISLALGVGLVVLVLSIYGIVSDAFQRNATVGYNLVVGAKGSPLQLTLNTVYYLSQPVENLPYSYYLEFFSEEERQRQLSEFGGHLAEPDRPGKYSPFTDKGLVLPVLLGDYFGEYRVVGTTPDFLNELKYGPKVDQSYQFREGRNFVTHSEENGYFEAVLGSRVAATMDVKIGDMLNPSHGDPNGRGHDLGFRIVGILEPTGTPNDRAAFVNMEGFYLMEGHAKEVKEQPKSDASDEKSSDNNASDEKSAGENATDDEAEDNVEALHVDEAKKQDTSDAKHPRTFKPLPINQREVTAILLRPTVPMYSMQLQNVIQEGVQAQAATPIAEIAKLMEQFVTPIRQVLLLITTITCVVAAVGIMVSTYNSMNDRRRDIAVMRALGARRSTVTSIVLLESGMIALMGGLLGWVVAHMCIALYAGRIEDNTGVPIDFFSTTSAELYTLPLIIMLAALAGFIPALAAYRTDVGRSLV